MTTIHKNDPFTLQFSDDIKSITEAVRIPLEVVLNEANQYAKEFRAVKSSFEKIQQQEESQKAELAEEHVRSLSSMLAFFEKVLLFGKNMEP